MTWVAIALGLAAGVDWRRVAILGLSLALPLPTAALIGIHWWRQRPDRSMRAPWFCDAISAELRAGASLRSALEMAARSVNAVDIADLCRLGAPIDDIGRLARAEFPEIGEELGALLARADGMGVRPASLFDEIGDLALAQIQVAHEVAIASAGGRAAAVVLLALPITTIVITAVRSGFDPYLAHPAQRAAALLGGALTTVGLVAALMILRRSR